MSKVFHNYPFHNQIATIHPSQRSCKAQECTHLKLIACRKELNHSYHICSIYLKACNAFFNLHMLILGLFILEEAFWETTANFLIKLAIENDYWGKKHALSLNQNFTYWLLDRGVARYENMLLHSHLLPLAKTILPSFHQCWIIKRCEN